MAPKTCENDVLTPREKLDDGIDSSWNENENKRTRSPTGEALLAAEAAKNNRKAGKRRRRKKHQREKERDKNHEAEKGEESASSPDNEIVEFEEVYSINVGPKEKEPREPRADCRDRDSKGNGMNLSRVMRGKHFAKGWMTNMADNQHNQHSRNDRTPSPHHEGGRLKQRAAPNTDQPIRNRRERCKEYYSRDYENDENTNNQLKLPNLMQLKNSRHIEQNHGSHYLGAINHSPRTPHSPEKRGFDDHTLPFITPRGTQTERRVKSDAPMSIGLPALKTSR